MCTETYQYIHTSRFKSLNFDFTAKAGLSAVGAASSQRLGAASCFSPVGLFHHMARDTRVRRSLFPPFRHTTQLALSHRKTDLVLFSALRLMGLIQPRRCSARPRLTTQRSWCLHIEPLSAIPTAHSIHTPDARPHRNLTCALYINYICNETKQNMIS